MLAVKNSRKRFWAFAPAAVSSACYRWRLMTRTLVLDRLLLRLLWPVLTWPTKYGRDVTGPMNHLNDFDPFFYGKVDDVGHPVP